MKLVYFIQSLLSSAGTERVLINKVNYLASLHGYEIYIITTEQDPDSLSFFEIDSSIHLIHLNIGFNRGANLFAIRIFSYFYKLVKYKKFVKRILEDIRPDISTTLLSHEVEFLYELNNAGIKIAENHFNKDFRFEFINNRKDSSILRKKISRIRSNLLERKVEKYDLLVSLTKEDSISWTSVKNKISIPNFIYFIPEQQSELINKKIIAVGRFAPEKGFDILLNMWKDVEPFYEDWSLSLFGEGECFEDYNKYIDEYSLRRVTLNEPTLNIFNEYIASDIFVSTSLFEGFGMTIIEAMACGLPVVAFDCKSGPKEIISNEEDGFLIEMHDRKSFVNALCCLMDSFHLRLMMGDKARRKVITRYNDDFVMDKWINTYKTLTDERMGTYK